jgi:tRNA A58 N-methylase Trm61
VLESGVGSGALSMTMLRVGAVVTGYEIREEFAERAIANVHTFLEKVSHLFTPEAEADQADLRPCQECGAPTPADICAFCKLVAKAAR